MEFCTGLLANEYFIALRQKKKKGEDGMYLFILHTFTLADPQPLAQALTYYSPSLDSRAKSKKSKKKPLKFETVNDEEEFLDSPGQFYMWKYSPMGEWPLKSPIYIL